MAPGGPWQYLLVDVDGTLLDSQGRIPPRGHAALARAVAAGMTLVLASGRTYVSLLRVTADLKLPFHIISNGGAVGLAPVNGEAPEGHPGFAPPHAHHARYVSELAPALWPRLVEALQREGLSVVVFGHRHPEPPLVYVASERGDPHFEAYLGRNRALARVRSHLASAEIPGVVEVAALGEGEAFDRASERVRRRFAAEAESHTMVLFIAAKFGKITEFFQRGTSKWNAFCALFPAAAPESVVAIGDEANDREMISRAGLGIAMGNATPELKALAGRVTATHDEDGLAQALEAILGRPG